MNEKEARIIAEAHYCKVVELKQDEDVLDTWFSSALWPFTTLGWPEKTPELERYYPGNTLITGFDIIFFWVARMMMMGLHFMKDVPFDTVYLHPLVCDEKGQKMSKSKGNIVDPIKLMDTYGADALRFSLLYSAAPGQDVKFSHSQIECYRNFATKLWNAARFCEQNHCVYSGDFKPLSAKLPINRWIIGRVILCARQLTKYLDTYRFDLAASSIYQFVWGEFCDWYLEFTKPFLTKGLSSCGDDKKALMEVRLTASWVLSQILQLIHPFMPFVSEELWQKLYAQKFQGKPLIAADWPEYAREEKAKVESENQKDIDWLIQLITTLRGVRAEINIPPAAWIKLGVGGCSSLTAKRLETHSLLLEHLGRIKAINVESLKNLVYRQGLVQFVHDEATFFIYVGDVINIKAERARLEKILIGADKEIVSITQKLDNKEFMSKAPLVIVDKNKRRRDKACVLSEKVNTALERLKEL
jgi:valyl-tRNA synthetase